MTRYFSLRSCWRCLVLILPCALALLHPVIVLGTSTRIERGFEDDFVNAHKPDHSDVPEDWWQDANQLWFVNVCVLHSANLLFSMSEGQSLRRVLWCLHSTA